jgi:FixJ family two-component response regulator
MTDRSAAALPPTVFVVDDDPAVRTALGRLLRSVGWTTRAFASAEEFLQEDLSLTGGCLIADVHLGRMSGLELLAALGTRPDSMPVILTSGVNDADMEREASRLGAIAFFRKPFDVSALLDSVRQGLSFESREAGNPGSQEHSAQ